MPRNRPVKALRPDLPLPRATALVLRAKLPNVLRYQEAVESGGVDGVHDMRIEAKRLREAVRVLKPALSASAARRLLPVVEQLNDLLGQVRDRDVLSEAFTRLQARHAELGGLKKVVRTLQRDRRSHHRELVKYLRQLARSDFAAFYDDLIVRLRTSAKTEPLVLQFATEAIRRRLHQVLAHLSAIRAPEQEDRFHRQRIRVKKLKYALEPFLSLLPADTRPVYRQIATLQELMGKVHDLDVQLEVLREWGEEHGEAPWQQAAVGTLREDRKKLARKTVKHLKAMEAARFDEVLLRALAGGGEEP